MTRHSPADYHFAGVFQGFQKLSGLSDFLWLQAIEVLVIPYMVKMGGILKFQQYFQFAVKKKFG